MDSNDPFVMTWDETPEDVDQNADHLPEGHLRVKLVEQKLDEKHKQAFKFQIVHGPMKNRFHTERLMVPRWETGDNQVIAEKRMKLFASRMGAVPKGTKGPATLDWNKGVGQEYVLEMVRKPDKKTQKMYTNMDFNGIWPIDHPHIATLNNTIREKLGLPPIAGNDAKPGAVGGAASGATTPPVTPPPPSQMAKDIFS